MANFLQRTKVATCEKSNPVSFICSHLATIFQFLHFTVQIKVCWMEFLQNWTTDVEETRGLSVFFSFFSQIGVISKGYALRAMVELADAS